MVSTPVDGVNYKHYLKVLERDKIHIILLSSKPVLHWFYPFLIYVSSYSI